MTILYITQNGITSPIGRSQVAPYLLGLARTGLKIKLLSAEPQGQEILIAHYKKLFDAVDINWKHVLYQNKPAIVGPVITQLRLILVAWNIVSKGGTEVVHCRSHPTALIGFLLKKYFDVKFIFDFRDFYADWGLQNTSGIKRLFYQVIKWLEGPMVRTADKIVCLTHRARKLLIDTYFGGAPDYLGRLQVVPCCADFEHFDLSKVSAKSINSVRERLNLPEDAFVLLYLGTLGTDYLLGKMITLFKQLLKLQPKAHFLFVSNNGYELVREECANQRVPIDCIRFTTAQREVIPAHIALADLSVVFIRADHTKVGCSPTKLAELFACNVPVIANPGVGDLDDIIDPSKNGSVMVRDFSDEALLSALEKAISCINVGVTPVNIRENSRIFSLDEGVASYQRVYEALLKSPC